MKKIFSLLFCLALASCINAGDNGDVLMPERNNVFTYFNGEAVRLYSSEPQLIKTELVNEKNYNPNQSMTAARGYSVLNNKIYRKDVFQNVAVRPNKTGALNSSSLPEKLEAEKTYRLLGETELDGKRYRLVEASAPGYVLLIDDFGRFYKKMGELKGATLVLLDPDYYAYPEDLKMVEVVNSQSRQTKPVQGFDVKYDGINLDRLWFTYFEFANEQADQGAFKRLSFPNKPGLIEINGVGFRVLNATNDKLDYMVVTDQNR